MFNDVHFSIMIATGVIFLLMIAILNSMLYKPLIKFMDSRDLTIKNDEEKMKKNSDDVSNVESELEKIHIQTRDEINQIKAKAIEEAKLKQEKELSTRKRELEDQMLVFLKSLREKEKELKEEMRLKMPEFKQSFKNSLSKI
ncbi:ATP synthase, F0 complex, b' subunit [Campylobacter subantarcticus LMG 24377]|uniref:ATP synthase, F0 complex, b' subunit n=2 Tax=Campylobacter subantarcticus TaxID=497724 RepID=A0A0A8HB15_9BACT|nr:ATP synthase, F0 complex, b' subunit [Campylobacter subantarcticus]EAJ1261349.1 ATP synthase, F0 complex, b' subunit [Campylobacter lari]AJC90094.1 ATP synthase, F0 complex, b' subunit [Campylobacter subantarcticus LMG 24374]AJC91761.1 ATP synthase, F0 complex, b' subunit [Campylobacter subantarcticus LMG 24377]EAL3939209.1 ATP synthase, F0 complex, b' subunit [Campylobacter lari]MPC00090.1 ATP synthase, F0 complex, b' subunit [Campylobacter subantarcticus]